MQMHESQVVTVEGIGLRNPCTHAHPALTHCHSHTISIAYSFAQLTFALAQFQYIIIIWIRVLNLMCICFDTFHVWDTLFLFGLHSENSKNERESSFSIFERKENTSPREVTKLKFIWTHERTNREYGGKTGVKNARKRERKNSEIFM